MKETHPSLVTHCLWAFACVLCTALCPRGVKEMTPLPRVDYIFRYLLVLYHEVFMFFQIFLTLAFACPQKKSFLNKRDPPNLQKDGNISDTVGGEKQEVVQDGEGEEEDKEKKMIR